MSFRITEDGQFRGTVTFLDARLNSTAVNNSTVDPAAAIAASKMEHQHRATYAQESATTAADETRVVHVVIGTTGTVTSFQCGAVVANVGDSVVDFDLLKDGVSILTAAVQIDSSDAAYTPVAGTISSASVAAGDVLEVDIDATIGTGTLALGVYATVDISEDFS